jgi:hypothetical protein
MKTYIFNIWQKKEIIVLAMKFPVYNYLLSVYMALAFVCTVFPISLTAALPYNIEDQQNYKTNGLNEIKSTNYSHTENSILKSIVSGELDSTSGPYFVQTQGGPGIPEDDSQNTDPSNGTANIETSTENKVTSDGASDSDPPASESTDKNDLTPKSSTIKCEGSALCVTGEVVKVINGKTFYVNIQNKIYKVELALIGLPIQSEDAMRAATIYTRNTCLGSNILIDQDDGQKVGSFIAQVYCSPTKHLNSLLLQTGFVQLDKSQCQVSEFTKLDWAKSYGC